MSIRKFLLAGAGALILQSCVTAPAPVLTVDDLLSASYSLQSGREFDVVAFFGALPEWMTASYTNASFDGALGAMVVDDLVFELRDAPGYRIHIDRATIWDADTDAVAAVFDGAADMNTMTPLFDRLAFEGVRSEGMQWNGGAESVALNVDKMVFDGFAARSFSLAPKEDAREGVSIIRTVAAIANSYAYDGVAYSNFSFQLNNNQAGATVIEIAQAFARGYEAGRLDYQSAVGIRTHVGGSGANLAVEVAQVLFGRDDKEPESKILQPNAREAMGDVLRNPIALLKSAYSDMAVDREIDLMEMRDMDIRGGLSWLSRWELPPITETELLDFGSATIIGDRQIINGKTLVSTERTDISDYDFYWLVPSSISMSSKGSYIAVTDYIDAFSSEVSGVTNAATGEQSDIQQMKEALVALGLEEVNADVTASWHWDGDAGDTEFGVAIDVAEFADISYDFDIGGPSLAGWDALVRANESSNAVQQLTFGGFNFSVTDDQMLDRIFAYVAQEMGGTGEELRQSMPAMIRLAGVEAAEMNPRIPGYIDAIAEFIASSGTLSISANPVAPVAFPALQEIGQSAPQTLPDVLDLTITHLPQ